MEENRLRVDHLIAGLLMAIIVAYIFLSSPILTNESPLVLIIFDFLFVSFIFPLNGRFVTKIFLLLIGNMTGIFLNYLLYLLANNAVGNLGEKTCNVLYVLLVPFINLLWIVTFWSVSLTAMSKIEGRKSG